MWAVWPILVEADAMQSAQRWNKHWLYQPHNSSTNAWFKRPAVLRRHSGRALWSLAQTVSVALSTELTTPELVFLETHQVKRNIKDVAFKRSIIGGFLVTGIWPQMSTFIMGSTYLPTIGSWIRSFLAVLSLIIGINSFVCAKVSNFSRALVFCQNVYCTKRGSAWYTVRGLLFTAIHIPPIKSA